MFVDAHRAAGFRRAVSRLGLATAPAGFAGHPGRLLFAVYLPTTSASPPTVEERGVGEGTPRALEGVRVLLVDDESDAQEVARRALELYGVEVRSAGNTAQALAILENWMPTVLVSDIAMPGEDGYALIRHIRSREAQRGGHVAALAFTALVRTEDRSRILAAGFDGHVAKPADPTTLIYAIAAAVAGSAA